MGLQRIRLSADRELIKINDLLKAYKGYPARLWSYVPSLSRLEIRIDRKAAGNFHISLAGVTSITIPKIHWSLDGHIERDETEQDGPYVFLDEAARIKIVCGVAGLEENVESLYGTSER